MAAVRQLAQRAGCTAAYIENALTAAEADAAFRVRRLAVARRDGRVRPAESGRRLPLRPTAPSYAGLSSPPQPWTPELLEMRARCGRDQRPAEALTGVLLNNYRGSGSIPAL